MEETEEDIKKREIERWLYAMRYRFRERFGMELITRYKAEPLPEKRLVPLDIYVGAANNVLNTLSDMQYVSGISTIYHDDNVLMCRWCYYLLASEAGYSNTRMARYIKQNAPSVSYGLGRIKKLILENEKTTRTYQCIKAEVDKQIFGNI